MNSNKARISLLLVAVLVLSMVAFAQTDGNPAYSAFKEMMRDKDETEFEQGRMTMNMTVTDNGETVFTADGNINADKLAKQFSGTVNLQAADVDKTLQFYGADQTGYLLDVDKNDLYIAQKSQHEDEDDDYRYHGRHHQREFNAKSEAIFDYFVGDLSNNFSLVSDDDGSQDIQFEVMESEVPEIVNLMVSLRAERDEYDRDEKLAQFHEQLKAEYPLFRELATLKDVKTDLVDNVNVNYVKLVFDRDVNEQITGIRAQLTVSGNDEAGAMHTINFDGSMTVDSDDRVAITPIDQTGKTVYELPDRPMHGHRR